MSRAWIGMLSLALLAGCSGEYLVTLPDVAAVAGDEAVAVARMRRHEFLMLAPAMRDAMVVMWIDDEDHRGAYTDEDGYAVASLPAPDELGRHEVTLHHQDELGDEVTRTGRCYVLDGRRLVVAVDWEAIEDDDDAQAAAPALRSLGEAGVQIVYAAKGSAAEPVKAHKWLLAHGLPDGPVLSWGHRRMWYGRDAELVGSLASGRLGLAPLVIVAAGDDDLGDAAGEMDMVAMGVGIDAGDDSIDVADWAALAERVLAAEGLLGDRDFEAMTSQSVREALAR